jgi:DNA-binding PadR family transcriptional regulator
LSTVTSKRRGQTARSDDTTGLDLFSGFIKLHVLHHATEQSVYGLWLIEELAEHGYRVSPGTLYPLLHSLEEAALLKSSNEIIGGKVRRYYTITSKGRKQLKKAKLQLMELTAEIFKPEEFEQQVSLMLSAKR